MVSTHVTGVDDIVPFALAVSLQIGETVCSDYIMYAYRHTESLQLCPTLCDSIA